MVRLIREFFRCQVSQLSFRHLHLCEQPSRPMQELGRHNNGKEQAQARQMLVGDDPTWHITLGEKAKYGLCRNTVRESDNFAPTVARH